MSSRLKRRDVVRALPVVFMGTALGGIGRLLAACSSDESGSLANGRQNPYSPLPPTDGDEYTPPNGAPPTNAGDAPPTVPNDLWEARARQLEDEQARLYGPVFTQTAPGNFPGKERSHVPQVTKSVENGYNKVTVLVAHVMGANGLDAGAAAYDGGADAGDAGTKPADAGASDAGDAGAKTDAGAVDAGPKQDAASLPVHYITTMYLRGVVDGKDTVVGLWEFRSTDPAPPSVKFTVPKGVTEVTAFEWCTIHGLWKADPLTLP